MPRLDDDLMRLTLDLHGASVDEAERLLLATLRVAMARGRTSVRVIHGASTSLADPSARTIKHTVEALIRARRLPGVTGFLSEGGATVLALPIGTRPDRRRITLRDVW